QFAVMFAKSMRDEKMRDNPFAGFAQIMVTAMIGPMVDAMISPEALATMIRQGKPPSPKRTSADPSPPVAPAAAPGSSSEPRVTQAYEGLDIFKVTVSNPATSNDTLTFVLTRNGWFSWRLTSIRLPDSLKL